MSDHLFPLGTHNDHWSKWNEVTDGQVDRVTRSITYEIDYSDKNWYYDYIASLNADGKSMTGSYTGGNSGYSDSGTISAQYDP